MKRVAGVLLIAVTLLLAYSMSWVQSHMKGRTPTIAEQIVTYAVALLIASPAIVIGVRLLRRPPESL